MNQQLERRLLQGVVAVCCVVPIGGGILGVAQGAGMVGHAGDVTLDSHVRYLSGLLLAIGLCFASTIPEIEKKSARFLITSSIVVIGGLARGYGVLIDGWPSVTMQFALLMEIVIVPMLAAWQHLLARRWT